MDIIEDYLNYIANTQNTSPITTGFTKIDNAFEGGLPIGLTVIGAECKIGKTTLALNIADNMARQENVKVLFYSLELSKYHLVSKSLCRISYMSENLDTRDYGEFHHNRVENVVEYLDLYRYISKNLFIIDDIRDIDEIIDDIQNYVNTYTDDKIVVIIDYLQKIHYETNSDKQRVDYIVKELKQLSTEYKLPILSISSITKGGDLKESGEIEYIADNVLGLSKQSEKSDIRILQFKKTRFIDDVDNIKFKYYGKYATFIEMN